MDKSWILACWFGASFGAWVKHPNSCDSSSFQFCYWKHSSFNSLDWPGAVFSKILSIAIIALFTTRCFDLLSMFLRLLPNWYFKGVHFSSRFFIDSLSNVFSGVHLKLESLVLIWYSSLVESVSIVLLLPSECAAPRFSVNYI